MAIWYVRASFNWWLTKWLFHCHFCGQESSVSIHWPHDMFHLTSQKHCHLINRHCKKNSLNINLLSCWCCWARWLIVSAWVVCSRLMIAKHKPHIDRPNRSIFKTNEDLIVTIIEGQRRAEVKRLDWDSIAENQSRSNCTRGTMPRSAGLPPSPKCSIQVEAIKFWQLHCESLLYCGHCEQRFINKSIIYQGVLLAAS